MLKEIHPLAKSETSAASNRPAASLSTSMTMTIPRMGEFLTRLSASWKPARPSLVIIGSDLLTELTGGSSPARSTEHSEPPSATGKPGGSIAGFSPLTWVKTIFLLSTPLVPANFRPLMLKI